MHTLVATVKTDSKDMLDDIGFECFICPCDDFDADASG
jgi:hypothetical protein